MATITATVTITGTGLPEFEDGAAPAAMRLTAGVPTATDVDDAAVVSDVSARVDDVVAASRADGHDVTAITLPGLESPDTESTPASLPPRNPADGQAAFPRRARGPLAAGLSAGEPNPARPARRARLAGFRHAHTQDQPSEMDCPGKGSSAR